MITKLNTCEEVNIEELKREENIRNAVVHIEEDIQRLRKVISSRTHTIECPTCKASMRVYPGHKSVCAKCFATIEYNSGSIYNSIDMPWLNTFDNPRNVDFTDFIGVYCTVLRRTYVKSVSYKYLASLARDMSKSNIIIQVPEPSTLVSFKEPNEFINFTIANGELYVSLANTVRYNRSRQMGRIIRKYIEALNLITTLYTSVCNDIEINIPILNENCIILRNK